MIDIRLGRLSVALVCGSFNLGGSERNVVKIATGLDPARFSVCVIGLTGTGPLREQLDARGIPVSVVNWSFDPRRLHEDFARLRDSIVRAAPDILHVFNYPAIYFGVAAGVQVGVPVRIVAIQAQDTWKGWIEWIMDRLIRPAVTLYLADGDGARRFAIRHQGLDPGRVQLAYDGPDMEELAPSEPTTSLRMRLGLAPERPTVGVVARLQDAHKGQSVFLRSVVGIPESLGAQFVLVGGGEDEGTLRNLAVALGITDRVVFAGPQEQLAQTLHALDILVIPSRRFESVPKILVEGMAAGRPVVATRVGDIPEFLEDGLTGILVEPDHPEALASAITRLLRSPGEASALGMHARLSLESRGVTLRHSLAALSDLYLGLAHSATMQPGSRLAARIQLAICVYRNLRLGSERFRWVIGK